MTFDLPQILASKRAFRHTLAACHITEKLRMLDALGERSLALRAARLSVEDMLKSHSQPALRRTPPL